MRDVCEARRVRRDEGTVFGIANLRGMRKSVHLSQVVRGEKTFFADELFNSVLFTEHECIYIQLAYFPQLNSHLKEIKEGFY